MGSSLVRSSALSLCAFLFAGLSRCQCIEVHTCIRRSFSRPLCSGPHQLSKRMRCSVVCARIGFDLSYCASVKFKRRRTVSFLMVHPALLGT